MKARNAEINRVYVTCRGRRVTILNLRDARVQVRSEETGHVLEVPGDYELQEEGGQDG